MQRIAIVATVLFAASAAHAQAAPSEQDWQDAMRLGRVLGANRAVGYMQTAYDIAHLPQQLDQAYSDLLKLTEQVENDPVLGPMMHSLAELYRHGYVRLDANAGLSSDVDLPAGANASVDAAWELPICRVLHAAGSGQIGRDAGDTIKSYAFTLGACLPLPADTIQADYTRSENALTSLLSGPVRLRDRRTADEVNGLIRFYRYRGDTNQVDFMPIDIDVVHSRSTHDGTGDPDAAFGSWISFIDFSPVHWIHRRDNGMPIEFQFVQVHFMDQYDDHSDREADAGGISPLIIKGIPIAGPVVLDADVGIALATTSDSSRAMNDQTLIDRKGLHTALGLRAVVPGFVDKSVLTAELRGNHTLATLYDAQIVSENRIALSVAHANETLTARMEGFASRDLIVRDAPGGKHVFVGGAAAEVAWAVHPQIDVTGRVEVARSLTAFSSLEPVETADDVRAMLGVNVHYNTRWP
ncbi:MAG TPA: hypothetical protein VGM39_15885 [Kofleriaceae bacterium]|jgi:hypothetical protein